MKERWSTPSPRHPSWASSTASPTPCSCPTASPGAGVVILHGAGSAKESPLRLRARLPRRRHRRARLRRPRPRALGRASSAPARSTTRSRWSSCCAGTPARWRCAAPAWAASRRSTPAPATRRCAPWSRSARRPRTCCCAACARRAAPSFRCDAPATERWLEALDIYEAVGRAGARTPRCCCSTPAGDEQIPWTVSEELHAAAHEPKRLLVLPGGHHRSLQHDLELQAESRRFILAAAEGRLAASCRSVRRPRW